MTKPRNAAGQFAVTPAEAPKARGTADRRIEAERGIKQLEARRDSLTAQWRQGLVNEELSAVERCEHELDVVERKLRRSHALVELLGRAGPHVVQAQPQGWTWPSDIEGANAALLEIQPELKRLRAIPFNDRHAGHDRDQDFLVKREYALLRLIESFAPKEMVPTPAQWVAR